MIEIIETYKATISFTAPTAYRAMLAAMEKGANLSSLRAAVSAGETLPAPVFNDWVAKTSKPILDGIGSTERCTFLFPTASAMRRRRRPASRSSAMRQRLLTTT